MKDDEFGAVDGIKIGRGNPKYSEKVCLSTILSTTKPHMTWPGLKPGPPRWEPGD
jgi:hypothetical protein